MTISYLQSILIGLVSGLADFLPVSGDAHRLVVGNLVGLPLVPPVFCLFLHLGALAALVISCRNDIYKLRRERAIAQIPPRRRKRRPDFQTILTVRMLETAVIPMLLLMLFRLKLAKYANSLVVLSVMLVINGIILFLPTFYAKGNKDARNLTRFDGVLLGIMGAASAIPGLSRTGAMISAAEMRGVSRSYGMRFTLLLCIPGLIADCALDLVGIFTGESAGIVGGFVPYILGGIAAGIGSYLAIRLMRFLSVKLGFARFSFYNWGAALLCLILYLTAS